MVSEAKEQALKRLSYIEGHLAGVRKMVEEDQYCVDILKQTYAVRRAGENGSCLGINHSLKKVTPRFARGLNSPAQGPDAIVYDLIVILTREVLGVQDLDSSVASLLQNDIGRF